MARHFYRIRTLFCSMILYLISILAFGAAPMPEQKDDLAEIISALEKKIQNLQIDAERNSLYLQNTEERVDNLIELQERTSTVYPMDSIYPTGLFQFFLSSWL